MPRSHPEDRGTIHDWPVRRPLVASAIVAMGADVVALQEPSPYQAHALEVDLGPEWGVHVDACDPSAWGRADTYNPDAGPSDGQARDGNGVAWRRDRLTLISTKTFWLNPAPSAPARDPTVWNSSGYQRTCHVSKFTCLMTGRIIAVFSTHFDHEGGDSMETGGAEARRQSATLVMARALAEKKSGKVDVVIVAGDFNTFEDRYGATYSALRAASNDEFVDVREVPGVLQVDHGRGGGTWEGWETNQWSRANVGGEQRYDQIFVSTGTPVTRTSVLQEQYLVRWQGGEHYVYASDHLPVVAHIGVEATTKPLIRIKAEADARAPRRPMQNQAIMCLAMMVLLALFFLGLLCYILWDWAVGGALECRFECRDRRSDAPFDAAAIARFQANHTCVPKGI